MKSSAKILLIGTAVAIIVAVAGLANTSRLESKVRDLEALCVEEGKKSEIAHLATMVCDAESLSADRFDNLKSIQLEVSNAHNDTKQSKEWPYILSLAILAISALPVAWYFLLGRIRELSNAVKGK